ncbi:MAG: hypothetical protein WCD36_12500 [Rhodanobacteraceae bacterium]
MPTPARLSASSPESGRGVAHLIASVPNFVATLSIAGETERVDATQRIISDIGIGVPPKKDYAIDDHIAFWRTMIITPIAPPRSIDIANITKPHKARFRKHFPLSLNSSGEKITFIGFQRVRLEKTLSDSVKLNTIKIEKNTAHRADAAAVTQSRAKTPANAYPTNIMGLPQLITGSLDRIFFQTDS